LRFSAGGQWLDGGTTRLLHLRSDLGGGSWVSLGSASGSSPLTRTADITGSLTRRFGSGLLSNGSISDFVVTNQVAQYPSPGDGFNTLRGVAPGCAWAGAKVFTADGEGISTWTGAAIDDLVANRVTKHIKVLNLSLGTDGDPGISTSNRQKVNTAVHNGVVVVVSAGNDGRLSTPKARETDDPGRAAMALTVAAANDVNELTEYTSHGFTNPKSVSGQEEDYKPDLMAPGGSDDYTHILAADSNSGDGMAFSDQQSNDYYNIKGTSMASPFAAGCAALVIDALQKAGTTWDFSSSRDARLVKMVLCATATESNANREDGAYNPTLQRAATGPDGYPEGKDRYEGYGMINPDAAVEAVSVWLTPGGSVALPLGGSETTRRAAARQVDLPAGEAVTLTLNVPGTSDMDLYLYSREPGPYGTPVRLTSGTQPGSGTDEAVTYTSPTNLTALVVVKRVSGSGSFVLTWVDDTLPQAPQIASSTHPDQDAWVANNDPTFVWTVPPDASGIAGYSFILDAEPSTLPDTTLDSAANTVAYTNVTDGERFFHVRARDHAGNWGAAGHYRVRIDAAPPALASITSTNQDGTYRGEDTVDITVQFTEPVTLADGSLVATLETGAVDRQVVIDAIVQSSTASGVYTVQVGDASAALSVTSVTLDGATLRDGAGNDADLTLPVGQNLDDNRDLVIRTTHSLEIVSAHGTPTPPVGTQTYPYGAALTNAVPSPVIQITTQFVATGWTMIGNEPASGTTNAMTMTLTNDAVLAWNWSTNFWLNTEAGTGGSITPAFGWFAQGTNLILKARPDPGYHLTQWSGAGTNQITSGDVYSETIGVTMGGAVKLTASFAETRYTLTVNSAHGAPTPGTVTNLPQGSVIQQRIAPTLVPGATPGVRYRLVGPEVIGAPYTTDG
jgi:hypothetical protein